MCCYTHRWSYIRIGTMAGVANVLLLCCYCVSRWSYNRIGTMVCYFFYKNIIFALTLFWFNIWNGFSSQPLYDEGYQVLFFLQPFFFCTHALLAFWNGFSCKVTV